ncbi:hypothetical protein ABZV80_31960 [Streptomyces sp. NPDC005132]|uniref:hypothetical protein n=1 Tax=Streptomyces sp. NPDC005132 TaxID=3154294 RepID=UPI0033B4BA75
MEEAAPDAAGPGWLPSVAGARLSAAAAAPSSRRTWARLLVLDAFAARWHALPVSDGITLSWAGATAGMRRGRATRTR